MIDPEVGQIIGLNSVADILWEIPYYFNRCHKADTYFQSPVFEHMGSDWCLRIYPNGERQNQSVGFVGLYVIKLAEKIHKKYDVIFEISIIYSNGVIGKICNTFWYDSTLYRKGSSTCIERQHLQQIKGMVAPGGILTVKYFAKPLQHCSDAASQTGIFDGVSALSQDFQDLFITEQNSDITFKVKSREFRVHRLILEARSSVFAAMFKHDMKEKNTGVVKIDDCDPDIFHDFLSFIYAGKISILCSDNAIGLYALANKYDLGNLKEISFNYMKENLSLDSVCDVLAIADKFNERELKETAMKLVIANIEKVIAANNWIHFIKENPQLATEILKIRFSGNTK